MKPAVKRAARIRDLHIIRLTGASGSAMATCSRRVALAVVTSQSVHRLALQLVCTLNLPLGEELRVLLVVLLAQVENLLTLLHAGLVGLLSLGLDHGVGSCDHFTR